MGYYTSWNKARMSTLSIMKKPLQQLSFCKDVREEMGMSGFRTSLNTKVQKSDNSKWHIVDSDAMDIYFEVARFYVWTFSFIL